MYAPLTVVRLRRQDGRLLASAISYPCHPVVLGPGSRLWTADYPGVVRTAAEAASPGSVCLFLTGCCGDLNPGHSTYASMSSGGTADRSFAAAERIDQRIAVNSGRILALAQNP